MEDTLFFIFRYIPFWSIPLGMISLQFGYIYWIKEIRWVSYSFYATGFICFLFLSYYIYAGSPDDSARILDNLFREVKR
ncbi:MAG: hypothetical protein CME60_11065 [Halobacteriovoraceae bacterium]|nr:hypothetical protein [Halobacteriovoraceae bacterium]